MPRPITNRLFVTSAALSLLAACQQSAAPAVDTANIAAAVKGEVAGLVAAFNAHDAEKAVSYDAPDYVGMFHGAPNVVGPEADLAVTKQQVADPAAKVTEKTNYRQLYVVLLTDNGDFYPTLVGPAKTVEKHKKDFEDLLKGLK